MRNILGGGSLISQGSLNSSLSFIEAGGSPKLRKGGSNVSVLPSRRASNVSDTSVYRENLYKLNEMIASVDESEAHGKKTSK